MILDHEIGSQFMLYVIYYILYIDLVFMIAFFSFAFNNTTIDITWDGSTVVCKDKRFLFGLPCTTHDDEYCAFYINFLIHRISIQMYVVPIDIEKKENLMVTHTIEQITYSK